MDANLIPILSSLAFFATVFGISYIVIQANHKEKMALIENGADPALFQQAKKRDPFKTLKWGLLLVGAGIGILLGNLMDTYTSLNTEAAYSSMIFLFGGLGLTIAFLKRDKATSQTKEVEKIQNELAEEKVPLAK